MQFTLQSRRTYYEAFRVVILCLVIRFIEPQIYRSYEWLEHQKTVYKVYRRLRTVKGYTITTHIH